jgi:hypothetical protein
MTEKIEDFWVNATADDVARVMAGETVEARFRNSKKNEWENGNLRGWSQVEQDKRFWDQRAYQWLKCQVYREPSWFTDKPDPGPGYRLLEKLPDEPKLATDEYWSGEGWMPVGSRDNDQLEQVWYRRRIEQLLSGHRWLANGDRLESGDLYYEKGALLEVGHEYWGNKVMLAEAFMRKIEQPEPEPKHYVLRVGDTVENPNGDRIRVVNPGFEQGHYALKVGDTISLPNGQTITITEKGFEVTR